MPARRAAGSDCHRGGGGAAAGTYALVGLFGGGKKKKNGNNDQRDDGNGDADRSLSPKQGGGGGMFGGLGNLMDAMKKAQEFSKSAQDLQEQLKRTEVEATARDGGVRVVVTGQQVPLRVEVSDALLSEGNPAVNEAVTEAVQAAHAKSAEMMKQQLGDLTQGFGLPQQPMPGSSPDSAPPPPPPPSG